MAETCILMREPWQEVTPTATMVLEVSSIVRSQFLLIGNIFLCQLNQAYEYMGCRPHPQPLVNGNSLLGQLLTL